MGPSFERFIRYLNLETSHAQISGPCDASQLALSVTLHDQIGAALTKSLWALRQPHHEGRLSCVMPMETYTFEAC